MVINEILKYLLGISKCTKLPGKQNKTKQTNPEQIHMFTYSTYLHIGNNPDNYLFKIFSLVIYFYFITFLEKVVYSHFSNNISEMNTCCPMKNVRA